MARFYASISTDRSETHRLSANRATTEIRGWDVGVKATGNRADQDEKKPTNNVEIDIFATGGSNNNWLHYIGSVDSNRILTLQVFEVQIESTGEMVKAFSTHQSAQTLADSLNRGAEDNDLPLSYKVVAVKMTGDL